MLIRRETKNGGNDLQVAFRPCTIDEVLGNATVKNVIRKQIINGSLRHTLLFSGPTGCGKTTMARIIALSLNCSSSDKPTSEPCLKCQNCLSILNQNNMDCLEINVGSANGKDATDAVIKDLPIAPFQSRYKIVIFDEAHKLTTAAKDLLLKPMEDTYKHVFIIFCTNEPEKLIGNKKEENPFLDRCDHLVFSTLNSDDIYDLLSNVGEFEGVAYTDEVLKYIVELSKGVPRKALNFLGTAIADGTWDKAVLKKLLGNELLDEDDKDIMPLNLALLRSDYSKSMRIFSELSKVYQVESVRVAVCGYFVWSLKKATNFQEANRLSLAIDTLVVPIFSIGKPAEHIFYNYIFKAAKAMANK